MSLREPNRRTLSPRRRERILWVYGLAVTMVTAAVLATLLRHDLAPLAQPAFWLLLLALLITEPVVSRLVQAGAKGTFTSATVWGYAGLLSVGLAGGMVLQIAGVVLLGLLRRSPPVRTVFNVGQLPLSMVAAALVLQATVGHPLIGVPPQAVREIVPLLAALLVGFAVNQVALVVAISLLRDQPPAAAARRIVSYHKLPVLGMMLSSPIVALVVIDAPQLLPLLMVPSLALLRMVTVLREREHQAFHDHLTGLPNRAHVERNLQEALDGGSTRAAVLVIDLDGFKRVNDTLGHDAGDEVLQVVARRMRDAVRDDDLVARLGGDEFAVVLTGDGALDVEAQRCAERVVTRVAEPTAVARTTVAVEASVGLALWPDDADEPSKLLRLADVRMYQRKTGRSDALVDHQPVRRATGRPSPDAVGSPAHRPPGRWDGAGPRPSHTAGAAAGADWGPAAPEGAERAGTAMTKPRTQPRRPWGEMLAVGLGCDGRPPAPTRR